MAKRRKWNPQAFHVTENVSDVKRAIILAHLGELFYKELCSRELQTDQTPSIATRSEKLYLNSERKVANE